MQRPLLFTPGDYFPAITLTGAWCGLQCPYCRAHYLQGMLSIKSWGEAERLLPWLLTRTGVLVSGGFDRAGRLPAPNWLQRLLQALKRGGVPIALHCLNPEGTVERLVMDGLVDYIDFEIPVSEKHQEMMGVEGDPWSWLEELARLRATIAPHILVGLPGIDESEELIVLDKLSSYDFEVIVFIAFIPTRGTPFAHEPPPTPGRLLRVLTRASDMLGSEIAVGCMRPYSLKRLLDPLLASSGLVDRLAVPLRGFVRVSSTFRVLHACCSLPRRFLTSIPRSR